MPAVSVPTPAAAATPPDAVLLERFSRGDRTALDELFRRYRSVAYRVAYRLLGREAAWCQVVINNAQGACTVRAIALEVQDGPRGSLTQA